MFMIQNHDRWSKMGEDNLGERNIEWAMKMEEWRRDDESPGVGPMTLMKAIMNDYWADAGGPKAWPAHHVDMVMSKLYWCWVAWLEANHPIQLPDPTEDATFEVEE